MKLVSENLEEAAKFDRMAAEAIDPALKQALEAQAAAYRKLASRRGTEQNFPPANMPATTAQPQSTPQLQGKLDE